jgi:hypothetical protein
MYKTCGFTGELRATVFLSVSPLSDTQSDRNSCPQLLRFEAKRTYAAHPADGHPHSERADVVPCATLSLTSPNSGGCSLARKRHGSAMGNIRLVSHGYPHCYASGYRLAHLSESDSSNMLREVHCDN